MAGITHSACVNWLLFCFLISLGYLTRGRKSVVSLTVTSRIVQAAVSPQDQRIMRSLLDKRATTLDEIHQSRSFHLDWKIAWNSSNQTRENVGAHRVESWRDFCACASVTKVVSKLFVTLSVCANWAQWTVRARQLQRLKRSPTIHKTCWKCSSTTHFSY